MEEACDEECAKRQDYVRMAQIDTWFGYSLPYRFSRRAFTDPTAAVRPQRVRDICFMTFLSTQRSICIRQQCIRAATRVPATARSEHALGFQVSHLGNETLRSSRRPEYDAIDKTYIDVYVVQQRYQCDRALVSTYLEAWLGGSCLAVAVNQYRSRPQ